MRLPRRREAVEDVVVGGAAVVERVRVLGARLARPAVVEERRVPRRCNENYTTLQTATRSITEYHDVATDSRANIRLE